MTHPAQLKAARRGPPMKAGETSAVKSGVVTDTSTSTSPAQVDILGASFTGSAFYSFQAVGADVYVCFKAATSTPDMATTGGAKIVDGQIQEWELVLEDRWCEHIASASGKLRWWRSSERS